jgi:hypothetical protein
MFSSIGGKLSKSNQSILVDSSLIFKSPKYLSTKKRRLKECILSPLGKVMRSFIGEDENPKGIGLRIVNPVSSKTSL